MKRLIHKLFPLLTMIIVVSVCMAVPVSANTDSEERSTWEEVEEYCREYIGGFVAPTCADYVSMIMRDCAYYPGEFTQHPRAKMMRQMLKDNNYNLVASNITYRMSVGIDKKTAIKLGDWVAENAKPGDILIWVRNTSRDVENTGCSHVSIYCGVKDNMKSYDGKTSWPAHYSDYGEGGVVTCQALWEYINKGTTSGRGYGIYIYRRPGDAINRRKYGTWQETDNGYEFYDTTGTKKVSEFAEISGRTYYFDENGIMATGLQYIGEKLYYFEEDGSMFVGWKECGTNWYLFGNSGAARTGWIKIKNDDFYIDDTFRMRTGILILDDKYFYLDSTGRLKKTWVKYAGQWLYLDGSGNVLRTIRRDGGSFVCTDSEDKPLPGWQKVGGDLFCFDAEGRSLSGWQTIDKKMYYFGDDQAMMSGLVRIDGKIYYLGDKGAAVTGWKKIGDAWYCFGDDGAAACSEWITNKGNTYYFDSYGKMVSGLRRIGLKYYYFDGKGIEVKGWKTVDGSVFYFDEDGGAATGWKKIRNKWYYFNTSGIMLSSTSAVIDGRTYDFDGSGVCSNR